MQNAFRRGAITLLAIFGVGLATALMTVLLSLNTGIGQRFLDTGRLATEITLSPADAPLPGLAGLGSPLPREYVRKVESLPHVRSVTPSVTASFPRDVLKNDSPLGVLFVGVPPDDLLADPNSPARRITSGRAFHTPDEIIVGSRVNDTLSRLGGRPYRAGDVISLTGVGRKPYALRVVGLFMTGDSLLDNSVYGHLTTVAAYLGYGEDQVSTIRLEVDSIHDVEGVAARVRALFRSTQPPAQVTAASRFLIELGRMLDLFDRFLLATAIVSAVAGAIIILIIMLMSVTERRREFGILKAAGWSSGNILFIVLVESITLAAFGVNTGFALGAFAVAALRQLIGIDLVVISPALIAEVGVFALLAGVLSGLHAGLYAARVPPIEPLRAA
ncbi:MAG: ABC transporter permease [Chloroflexi bacterium]|nr:ABC transporter permease [Chloroflexota bacterium]